VISTNDRDPRVDPLDHRGLESVLPEGHYSPVPLRFGAGSHGGLHYARANEAHQFGHIIETDGLHLALQA